MRVRKKSFVFIAIALAWGQAWAQQGDLENLPVDLQNEIAAESASQDPNIVRVQEERMAQPSQGVLILNSQTASNQNANSATQQVLQQPTTYVQASPLTDSKAEQLRQQRQNAEIQTEQRIVEKLEVSRLEDEKERAERLFGDRWEKKQEQQQQLQQPVPVYGQYEQPQQTVEVVRVEEEEDKEDISAAKDEIISAVREANAERIALEEAKENEKKKDVYYVGGILGFSEYDADNVESNGSGGFSVGTIMGNGVIVEGSFLYSNYYLDKWWRDYDFFKEIDQYNFNIAVKYSILPGRIKPFAGAMVGYTYRKYTDRSYEYDYGYSRYDRYSGGIPSDEEVTSNAVDVGFLVGLDFFVSDNMSVGAEYRYTMNMFNKADSEFLTRREWREPENTEPLENIDYSVFAITGKVAF